MPPLITGAAADRLVYALDALLGVCAGLAFWGLLSDLFKAPDAPPLWACVAFGLVVALYSRLLKRLPPYDDELDSAD